MWLQTEDCVCKTYALEKFCFDEYHYTQYRLVCYDVSSSGIFNVMSRITVIQREWRYSFDGLAMHRGNKAAL